MTRVLLFSASLALAGCACDGAPLVATCGTSCETPPSACFARQGTCVEGMCRYAEITQPAAGDGCCAAGATAATDPDCGGACGDGLVTAPERCDTAITSGPGACPAACDDGDGCTADVQSGSACTAACSSTPITQPVSGDGCCPPSANETNDSDCRAPTVSGPIALWREAPYCTGFAAGNTGFLAVRSRFQDEHFDAGTFATLIALDGGVVHLGVVVNSHDIYDCGVGFDGREFSVLGRTAPALQKLSESGAKVGPLMDLGGFNLGEQWPSLAWNGEQYLMGSVRYGRNSVRRVSADGGHTPLIDVQYGQLSYRIGAGNVASDGDGWAVAFQQPTLENPTDLDAMLQLVDADGLRRGPVLRLASGPADQAAVSVEYGGGVYLTGWWDEQADAGSAAGVPMVRAISRTGVPLSEPLALTATSKDWYPTPSMVWNGRHFIVTWTEYPDAVRAQRINTAGQRIGAPFTVVATDAGEYLSGGAVAALGSRTLVVYARERQYELVFIDP